MSAGFFVSSISQQSPPSIIPFENSAACEEVSQDVVGVVRLSDTAREALIVEAGALIERHWAVWEAQGCFAARGMADRARMSMEALIRGRSPAQVAKMERERGLS